MQDADALGIVRKKFMRTSDLDFVFMGDDSARFGHEPGVIPPFPSENTVHKQN